MKKINYQPYKTFLIEHTEKSMREFGLIKKRDTVTPEHSMQFNCHLAERRISGQGFGNSMTDWVLMSEYAFLESDRYTIFPSSTDVLDTIMRSKLNVTDFDSLVPPAESFVVMLPHGYKTPTGIPLRSFLVQWSTMERNTALYNRLAKKLNVDFHFIIHGTESMIDVIALDSELAAIRSSIYGSEVSDLLDATDYDNDDDSVFSKPDNLATLTADESELKQLQAMHKMAIGLAVFDSAYDDFLVKGLPLNTKLKKVGHANLDNAVTIGANLKPTNDASRKSGHIRGFHFRQLRDKRFYTGQNANRPIGSRYVPVSESWVGDKIDSHVTNEEALKVK